MQRATGIDRGLGKASGFRRFHLPAGFHFSGVSPLMVARCLALAAFAAVALLPCVAPAAPLYWDPTLTGGSAGGGSGVWSTTTVNWWNGSSDVLWSYPNDADFASGSGTVTVSGNQSVNDIIFDYGSSGYTVNSGTLTLTSGTITANQNATINSVLTGSFNLVKMGTATLTLGGVNTFNGGTNIYGGMLSISSDSNLGNVPSLTAAYLVIGNTAVGANAANAAGHQQLHPQHQSRHCPGQRGDVRRQYHRTSSPAPR